jgi:hypothetical protein
MAGSWLEEAESFFRPFKPLVAGSSPAALIFPQDFLWADLFLYK